MVKIKNKVEETEQMEKDLVKEYWEDAAADIIEERKEESKKEEKPQVVPSKEKICEFYWIMDSEILDSENDLSKYGISAQEKAVLDEWAESHKKAIAKDVTFDIYDSDEEVRAVLNKYWVTPADVANNRLDELNESEKKTIINYYNKKAGL